MFSVQQAGMGLLCLILLQPAKSPKWCQVKNLVRLLLHA